MLHPGWFRKSNSNLISTIYQRIALIVVLCGPAIALAHTPHDSIDSLEVSPAYNIDDTVFTIVHNSLLRSTDKGESWSHLSNGLDNRFVLSDIAITPNFRDYQILFVSSDGDGVFRSQDGGESWHRFSDGLGVLHIGRLFVVRDSSENLSVLAAGSTGGLFVSDVSSPGWKRAMPDNLQITAIERSSEDQHTTVWLGDSGGRLWRSDENFIEWDLVHNFGGAGALTAIGTSSVSLILVGSESSGLYRSTDGGISFQELQARWPDRHEDCRNLKLAAAEPDVHIRDITMSFDFDDDSTVFVTTWYRAVLVSRDAGDSWQLQDNGITCDNQAGAEGYSVPHFRNIELTNAQSHDLFLAAFDGLFRSQDNGQSWIQLETLPISLIRGMSISPSLGSSFQLAISTYGGGAYVSNDKGDSWSTVNTGLMTTRLADIAYSPDYPLDGTVFAGSRERLLYSNNIDHGWTAIDLVYRGARRWLSIVLNYHMGLPPAMSTHIFLSDAERRLIWPMQIAVSPAYAEDKTVFIGHRSHGVWKSSDKGLTWERNWTGPVNFVTALEVSPNYANDMTVFAAVRGAGILRTNDNNESWQIANSGFHFLDEIHVPESPNHTIDKRLYAAMKDVLLVISPDFARDRLVFASSAEGLFVTGDAGNSWRRIEVPPEVNRTPVTALAISPTFGRDRTLLVNFKGRGLYKTIDGAKSFEQSSNDTLGRNRDIRYLKFSPLYRDDKTIFAATDEDLFRSNDGGASWTVTHRPVRYEDWRGEYYGPIVFEGDWIRETGLNYSASSQAVSDIASSKALLRFVGSEIVWRGECGPAGGEARVFVDGQAIGVKDLYCEHQQFQQELVRVSELEYDPHEIVIEVTGNKNARSSGSTVTIDSLDVEPR